MKTKRPETKARPFALFYNVIAPLIMSSGVGDGKTTACVMAQAATIDALRKGETLDKPTDKMACACPVLRRMAILANDTNWWKDDAERTEYLRPLIPLLLDSRVSQRVTWKRIFHTVDRVVRELTPMRLGCIADHSKNDEVKKQNAKGAKILRGLKRIKNKADCVAAREAITPLKSYAYASASADAYASASAYASAAAYASADAYAYASASADASAYASAAADASAYAYASAAASADASAYAYAQKLKYRTAYLALFREVAAITK